MVGHGTHTTGSVCGKTVGVAPKAKWFACRGCDTEYCLEDALLECLHFMAAPWLQNDTTPTKTTKNPSQRPHVVI